MVWLRLTGAFFTIFKLRIKASNSLVSLAAKRFSSAESLGLALLNG
jgi:hypothetical protein